MIFFGALCEIKMSIEFNRHAFIYAEIINGCCVVHHYHFMEPLDLNQCEYPFEHEFNREDKIINNFELSCGEIIEQKFDYFHRYFYVGCFFSFPTQFPSVEKEIERAKLTLRKGYLNQELAHNNSRHIGSEYVLLAIGIELSKQYYKNWVEKKKNFSIDRLPSDVSKFVIFPFLHGEVKNIEEFLPEDFRYESLPFEWAIIYKYDDESTIEVSYNQERTGYKNFSFYNSPDENSVGIFINPEKLPFREDYMLPSQIQLVFKLRESETIFFKTEWFECPDLTVHLLTKDTLDSINWPQDG